MTTSQQLSARVAELIAQRRRFVQATVVRAQCPTSTRPGRRRRRVPRRDDRRVRRRAVRGGIGARRRPRRARQRRFATPADSSRRHRDVPGDPRGDHRGQPVPVGWGDRDLPRTEAPTARIAVIGATPIADALVQFGSLLGFSMDRSSDPGPVLSGATAVIVASHGRSEEVTIRAALDAGVGFIGLVASRTRGAAVLASLDLNPDEQRIVRSPVGLDIGARTAEEIALSILAEVVRAVRVDGLEAPKSDVEPPRPTTAIDPVCGMTVTIGDDTAHLVHDGVTHWFCNPGCRQRYADETLARPDDGSIRPGGDARGARRGRLPRRRRPVDGVVPRRRSWVSRCCSRVSRVSARPPRPRRSPNRCARR